MKMKKSFLLTLSVIAAGILINGCSPEEHQKGTIDFGMSPVSEALKAASTYNYDVVAALVTIVNEDGELVYDKEYVEFYTFGISFVTKRLQLDVGKYQITEFMLVDTSGIITWATPMEGSELAYLVDDPLPISFRVTADNTTHLSPQVVRVDDYNPSDFGYVNFQVEFIDRMCITIFHESLCDYWYTDSIPGIDTTGIMPPYYMSRMEIYGDGKYLADEYLAMGENRVPIPLGYEKYNLIVYDCSGQVCFREMFGYEELKHFSCYEGEMLHILCNPYPEPEVIITPEGLAEPTIDQGVFGMLTQLTLDSTATDPGLITLPLVADLYIYYAADAEPILNEVYRGDCYIYQEFYIKSLAIVRSNSMGYYQLPLRTGEYVYLLHVDGLFYIDSYISSRVPGRFSVTDGEITKLNIHYTPCFAL